MSQLWANSLSTSRVSRCATLRFFTEDNARSICARPSDSTLANNFPASVRLLPPPSRTNSGWPMKSSRLRICWLIALWVRSSLRAALEKLPLRAA
ncbi:hypothetical protein D3C71_1675030 [compost metagenome]